MISSFIQGFMLGLGAALPLGPINILIMNAALSNYKKGTAIGLGAMSADITYLALILFGIVQFLNSPTILDIIGIFGSGFLIYLAYLIYKNRNQSIETKKEDKSNNTKKGYMKLYISGYLLTFLSPYTIAFWISVAGFASSGGLNPTITIVGLLCAITLWITLMPYFVYKSKHKISQKVSYWIALGSAIVLTFFALSTVFKILFIE